MGFSATGVMQIEFLVLVVIIGIPAALEKAPYCFRVSSSHDHENLFPSRRTTVSKHCATGRGWFDWNCQAEQFWNDAAREVRPPLIPMRATALLRTVVVSFVLLLGLPASAQLRISEFMAANTKTLADENNSYEDWIEIQNPSATNVDLFNWSLTDSKSNPTKWRFPSTNLPPGGFIVVFASDKDRRTPGARLHTSFKLDSGGEYLALVSPSGVVATEFSPYPPQVSDVSYGFGPLSTNVTVLNSGASVRALVPSTNNAGDLLNYAWTGMPRTNLSMTSLGKVARWVSASRTAPVTFSRRTSVLTSNPEC
jgi:hypothetical protein